MNALIVVNYIMAVNQLPNIPIYWDGYHFVSNVGVQNIFTRTRYQEVLQNLHFASNVKQAKTEKSYRIRPIIDYLTESFWAVFSIETEQSID